VNYRERLLVVVALMLLSAFGAVAQECNRHIEAAGGFSFCSPQGWTIEARENQTYKQIFAPRTSSFTANINVKDEASSTAITTYVARGIKLIISNPGRIGAATIKLVEWGDFVTSSQLKGERVALETEYKGQLVRTVQYYFDDGLNRKLIFTGTCLGSERDRCDPVFERAAKSFRLER
jgi:hypothetical protein